MDELDFLIAKKQKLIYNFFEWPSLLGSRLIVIGISNTMDLPERILLNKVSSRLGSNRINFQPYTFRQLEDILKFYVGIASGVTREKGTERPPLITANAVELIARKIGAISGDARRLLEIYKKSLEIGESQSNQNNKDIAIDVSIVQQAISGAFANSSMINVLTNIPLMLKMLLCCIYCQQKSKGTAEVLFTDVTSHHLQLSRSHAFPQWNIATYSVMFNTLHLYKFIYTDAFTNPAPGLSSSAKLSLACSEQDLKKACQGELILRPMLCD